MKRGGANNGPHDPLVRPLHAQLELDAHCLFESLPNLLGLASVELEVVVRRTKAVAKARALFQPLGLGRCMLQTLRPLIRPADWLVLGRIADDALRVSSSLDRFKVCKQLV